MMIFLTTFLVFYQMMMKDERENENDIKNINKKKIAIKFYEKLKWNFIEKFARFLILSLSDEEMKMKRWNKKKISKIFR